MSEQTIVDFLNSKKIIYPFLKYGYDYVKGNKLALNPWAVEIHPTAKCNHRCIHCSYKLRNENRASLSKEVFDRIISDMINCKVHGVYFSGGGEPCTYEGLSDAIAKLNENDIEVSIITNGTLFVERGILDVANHLNYVAVSVPSCTQQTFEKITGNKNLDKVLSLPDEIKSKHDKPPVVGARIVITNLIAHEVPFILDELKKCNYDYALFKIVRDYEDRGLGITPEVENDLKAYIEKNEKNIDKKFTNINNLFSYKKPYRNIGGCHVNKMGLLAVITPDGEIYPNISEIGDKNFLVGNVNDSSFSDIWGSEEHYRVIEHSSENWRENKCKNCRCISYNNIINSIIESTPDFEDAFV